MSELRLRDNPENNSLSSELKQPEATLCSEEDKEKLTPRENDSVKASQESNGNTEKTSNPHPKLEINSENQNKAEGDKQSLESNEHEKLMPGQSKQDNTELGKQDNTELDKQDNTELGKQDNTKLGKQDNTELAKQDNPELAKQDNPELAKQNNPEKTMQENPEKVKKEDPEQSNNSSYKAEINTREPADKSTDLAPKGMEERESLSGDVSNASKMLNDPNLFEHNKPGDYNYNSNKYGKEAWGNLSLSGLPSRDIVAQRNVGGIDRRKDDDGGHLIGARFGGSESSENLEAQNRNLNRGTYKQLENKWANSLANGDKVFVYSSSYKPEGSDRPEAFIGYSITEHPDGSRKYEPFHCINESRSDQEAWDKEVNELNSGELPSIKMRSDLPDCAFNENGGLTWNPPFDGTEKTQTLEPGIYLRYGDSDGSFITRVPDGIDIHSVTDPLGEEFFASLQTPYDYDKNNWRILDVKDPIDDAITGTIAPQNQFGIFSENENSWQAQLPMPINQYDSIDVRIPYWNDTII